jgi:hypothetical protein
MHLLKPDVESVEEIFNMAENGIVKSSKKGQKPRRIGYLKMKVIEDLKSETIDNLVKNLASNVTEMDTNDSASYVNLKKYIPRNNAQVTPKEKVGEVLPWVHIAISHAKRQLIKCQYCSQLLSLGEPISKRFHPFTANHNILGLLSTDYLYCAASMPEMNNIRDKINIDQLFATCPDKCRRINLPFYLIQRLIKIIIFTLTGE